MPSMVYASKAQYLQVLDYCSQTMPKSWGVFRGGAATFVGSLREVFAKVDEQAYPEIRYILRVIDKLADRQDHDFKRNINAETYLAAAERFKWMEEYCQKHQKSLEPFLRVLNQDIRNGLLLLKDAHLPEANPTGKSTPVSVNYGDRLTSDSMAEEAHSSTSSQKKFDRLTSDSLLGSSQSESEDEPMSESRNKLSR